MPIEWNKQPASQKAPQPAVNPMQDFFLADPNNPATMGGGMVPPAAPVSFGGFDDRTTDTQEPRPVILDTFVGAKRKEYMEQAREGLMAMYDPVTGLPYDPTVGMLPDPLGFSLMADLAKGAGNMFGAALQMPGDWLEAARRKFSRPNVMVGLGSIDAAHAAGSLLRDSVNALPSMESPLVQGVGQVLGLATTGNIGGAGLLGSASGAAFQYDDAIQHDATANQSLIALLGGHIVGATDALPLAAAWKRLDKATNGKLQDFITGNKYFQDMPDWVKREAFLGMVVEGGQEGGQTIAENWIARDLAGYDPTRSLNENLAESLLTGGTIGGATGYMIGRVRAQHKQKLLDAYLERVRDLAKQGGINALEPGAQFTPLQEYIWLNKEKADIEAALAAAGEGPMQEHAKLFSDPDQDPALLAETKLSGLGAKPISITTPTGNLNRLPPEDQVPNMLELYYNEEPRYQDFLNNTPTEARIHPDNVSTAPEDEGRSYSILEALRTRDVVTAEINPYEPHVSFWQKKLEYDRKLLEDLKVKEADRWNHPEVKEAREKVEKEIKLAQKELKILREKTRIAEQIAKDVHELVAALRVAFGANMKFVITDGSYLDDVGLMEDRKERNLSGAISVPINNIPLNDDGTEVGQAVVMYLKMDQMVTKVWTDKQLQKDMLKAYKASGATKGQLKQRREAMKRLPWYKNTEGRELFAVIAHEAGHRIITSHLNRLIQEAKAGNREAARVFFALFDEYQTWIKQAAKEPLDFFAQTVAAIHHLKWAGGVESFNQISSKGLADQLDYMRYLYSFDEFFAEKTARILQNPDLHVAELAAETKFYKEVAESFRKFFNQIPDKYKDVYDSNWMEFLKSQGISAKLEELRGEGPVTLLDLIKENKEYLGFSPKDWAGLQGALDKWSWVQNIGQTLLQNAKDNPHVAPLQAYVRATTQWAAFTRNMTAGTNQIIKDLNKIGKGSVTKISSVLFEEAKNKARYTAEQLSTLLDETEVRLYNRIRGELDNVLKMMKELTIQDARRTLADNPAALEARLKELDEEFNKMQQSAYFPFMRFGKYTIYARAQTDLEFEGEQVKKGQTITFQTFESETERDLALEELQKDKELANGRAVFSKGILSDTEFAIQGMPRAMLISLRNSLKGEDASAEQLAIIDRALESATPFQSFRKQWIKKKGIHGYSEDMMRSFASYMRMAAGHMARVRYAPELFGHIQQMDTEIQLMQKVGEPAQKRQLMRNWLARHFSYIMNPTNEWTALRGAISVAYLGLNIKSAALQLAQIPQVVYPYLAARYGDAASVAALTKAPWVMRDYVLDPTSFNPAPPKDSEFTRLFKGSKVVDSQGHPIRLYYGTDTDADFAQGELNFTDNPVRASRHATQGEGPGGFREGANVRPVYLNLKNPATNEVLLLPEVAEVREIESIAPGATKRKLQELGYDGIIFTHPDGEIEYTAFDPSQVINALTYKPDKPRSINQLPEKERLGMMITQGINEQWLDQSFATELALAASENTLDRGLAVGSHLKSKAKRMWHKTTRFMMLPFHITEKANRFTTAIAAYRLEFERTGDHNRAVYAAREANWSANFEYARWNRPEFSRGKKSVALMFASFWQNSLYFATKDPGATRYWLMMLFLAGAMGLPFAEDIDDLLSGILTWGREKLGYKNPYVDLQLEAREFLQELNTPAFVADYILHGISSDSFGAGLIEELTGIPIPRIDASASLSLGNIIPGTELIQNQLAARGRPNAGATAIAGAVEAGAGATGSLVMDLINAAVSGNVSTMKEAEKLIPFIFARNVSKAFRMMTEGQEKTQSGEPIAQFDLDEPRDIAEMVLQGLGFTPRKVSQGWQEHMATKQMIAYYESRRRILQAQLNQSFLQEDREARADALKAIREFNKNIPYPEFAITDPGQGVEQFLQRQVEAGVLGINEKRYLRIRRQIGAIFGSEPTSAGIPDMGDTSPP
jgi:hypothetical protein